MVRVDETWHRLLNWTTGQAPSERLTAQVLAHSGYEGIDPSHPLGGRDGGRDGICTKDGKTWSYAVYFPRDQQSFGTIEDKFDGDLGKAAAHTPHGLAFVTNQEMRLAERRELTERAETRGLALDLFHLERVAVVLDDPRMASVRKQYLDIEPGPLPIEVELRIDGEARYFTDSDAVSQRYIENTSRAEQGKYVVKAAKALEPKPFHFPVPDPWGSKPAPLPTQDEFDQQLRAWTLRTGRNWGQSEEYLAAHHWPGLKFHLKNVGEVFLDVVQVIITIEGAQGIEWENTADFEPDEFVSPLWPQQTNSLRAIRFAIKRQREPVTWRNTTPKTVQITVDIDHLRPHPEWDSAHNDLVLRATDVESPNVIATWTVTAHGYGKAHEGPPVEIPVASVNHNTSERDEGTD